MSATKPTDDDHDETAAPADAPVATDDKPAEADDRAASNGADAEAGADADAGADAKAGADADAGADAKAGAGETSSAEDDDAEAKDNLLARGNPLRWKRGLVAILGGGFPAFLLMAKNGQNGWALPLGLLFVCVAVFGVMDLLGTFDDGESGSAGGEAEVESSTSLRALAPSLGAVVALTVAFGAILSLAQSAVLSPWLAAVLVPGSFIGLVAAVFAAGKQLGPWRTDEVGVERPLTSRHGFWVVVIGALLYLPLLGMFSLWDPWETHYGEVAREILSRDDWISLWWAQDGWFWSKPILNFWIQSLAMGSLGTHYQPDQMMIAADGTAAAHAEWVVRTPNVLMTIGAMYLLYKGVAKVFGRRAGLLGAIVLATMPDWFFLAHQTMTDMPFVAAMTAAMGLLLFGLNTDEDARVRLYEVDAFGAKLRFSLWHLVFGAVLLCAVPQILYLLSRNVELVVFGEGPKGFHFHWDEFRSGSAGNCDLPGNEKCASHSPASLPKTDNWWHGSKASSALAFMRFFAAFEPGFQAIAWAAVLGGALYLNWGERRARRLVYIAAWLCAAIATMAKGPAGFGLPIICAIAYVATKKRWSELLRFELISGLLIILAVALPWYVAMYVRHGSPFTDRLIFHDMFNRAFSHVHDTNEGDDTGIRYYVWQLGYAAFPWTGLVPLGLLWGFRRSDSALARVFAPRATSTPGADGAAATPAGAAVGDASVMLVMWFLFAFALFTFMGTVPPLHLPRRPAGGDARRRRARRHAGPRDDLGEADAARGLPRLPRARGGHRDRRRVEALAGLAVRRQAGRRRVGERDGRRRDGRDRRRALRRRRAHVQGQRGRAHGHRPGPGAVAVPRRPRHPQRRRGRRVGRDEARPPPRAAHARGGGARGGDGDRPRRARPRHEGRGLGRDRRHPAPPALHVQLPAPLARHARLQRDPRRLHGRRGPPRPRARGAVAPPSRRRGGLRLRAPLGGLGPRRLHDGAVPALGAARGDRGLLPRSQRPRGDDRRVPDELEGRELLHGQPHPGLRLDGRQLPDVAQEGARQGDEGPVLRHRAQSDERPAERSRGEELQRDHRQGALQQVHPRPRRALTSRGDGPRLRRIAETTERVS
ncbi:MAG: glycosyltransferase family 39 protein [Labilithrix sp.]|nr:glycosyltransferase family 39 protein [Labilithrix sp.]